MTYAEDLFKNKYAMMALNCTRFRPSCAFPTVRSLAWLLEAYQRNSQVSDKELQQTLDGWKF